VDIGRRGRGRGRGRRGGEGKEGRGGDPTYAKQFVGSRPTTCLRVSLPVPSTKAGDVFSLVSFSLHRIIFFKVVDDFR